MKLKELKYPIGDVVYPVSFSADQINEYIEMINSFPSRLKNVVHNLTTEELNWSYRPDGWKVKQVIHHLADSHMNAVIRVKWTLTEDNPIIKPYHEASWCEMADDLSDDISYSIKILEGIHEKWRIILDNFSEEDLDKYYIHPTMNQNFTMKRMLCLYAWHGNHHLAHIQQALIYKGDFSKILA